MAHDNERRGDGEGAAHERELWRQRVMRAVIAGIDPRVHRPGSSVDDDAGGVVVYNGGALSIAAIADAVGWERLEAILGRFIEDAYPYGASLDTETFLDALALDSTQRASITCRPRGEPACLQRD